MPMGGNGRTPRDERAWVNGLLAYLVKEQNRLIAEYEALLKAVKG